MLQVAEILILLANLATLALVLKLYTEVFKELSQRDRNRGSDGKR